MRAFRHCVPPKPSWRRSSCRSQNTEIRAPFAGILERRQVEVGDYVAVNGEIATIVDNDPLVVTTQIAQQNISDIELGDGAAVCLSPQGRALEGQCAISRRAQKPPHAPSAWRSKYPIRTAGYLRAPAPRRAFPPVRCIAHFISPALLSLDATGQIGIKTVTDAGVVEFHPTTIVLAEAQGIWVERAPDRRASLPWDRVLCVPARR